MTDLQTEIEALWERRADLSSKDTAARDVVTTALDSLDDGSARVAEKIG